MDIHPSQIIQFNRVTTTDPTVNDDESAGYDLGATWLNTTSKRAFILLDVSVGAAVWTDYTVPSITAVPDRVQLFDLGAYSKKDSIDKEVIQYTRVFLNAGDTITGGECFIATGSGGKNVRFGLYDQADPKNRSGVPATKVRETAQLTSSGFSGQYLSGSWTGGDYVVPATGFYWIAFVVNDAPDVLVTEVEYEAGYLPRREATTTGTTLPASAAGLSNPKSAVAQVALIKVF